MKIKSLSKFIPIFLLIPIILLLYNYEFDSNYLKLRTADSIWASFEPELKKILAKGDYITYKHENFNKLSDWRLYQERFQEFVDIINSKNSPKMFDTYTLRTRFKQFGDKVVVDFYLYNKNLSNHKFLPVKHSSIIGRKIDFKSLIPVLLGFAMSFSFMTNALTQLVILFSASSIATSYSTFIALWKIIVEYTHLSITDNSFLAWYLILSIFASIVFLTFLSFLGTLKLVKKLHKSLFDLVPILFNLFPYVSTIFTAWWYRTRLDKKHGAPLTLIISVVLSSLLFTKTSFSTLALHTLSINILIYGFLFLSESKIFNRFSDPLSKAKYLLKPSSVFIWSILSSAFVVNIVLNIYGIRPVLSILYSITLGIFLLILLSYKQLILHPKDLFPLLSRAFVYAIPVVFFVFLSFMLYYALLELGTPSYLISFINKVQDSSFLIVIVFFISTLVSLSLANFILSYIFLAPFITKIASIHFDPELIKLAIVEGIILGEILAPFSLSNLIISKLYKIKSILILKNIYKPLLLIVILANFNMILLSYSRLIVYIINLLEVFSLFFLYFYNYKKK